MSASPATRRRHVVVLLGFAVSGLVGSTPAIATPAEVELEHVLAELAKAAERYLEEALTFTAEETTRVLRYPDNSKSSRAYRSSVNIYFYQRTAAGGLVDRRIKREAMRRLERQLEQSRDVSEIVADLSDPMGSYKIPFYVVRPYGWIAVFSKDAQARYEYESERLTDYEGGPAVRIRFKPVEAPFHAEDWFGSAVVALDSFQILFAEGLQLEDHQSEQRLKAMLDSDEELPARSADRTFVVRQISTEFSVVKNGLRLPSRVHSRIYRYVVRGSAPSKKVRERLVTEVIQKFENYKFYSVSTGKAVPIDSRVPAP